MQYGGGLHAAIMRRQYSEGGRIESGQTALFMMKRLSSATPTSLLSAVHLSSSLLATAALPVAKQVHGPRRALSAAPRRRRSCSDEKELSDDPQE